MRAGVMSAGWWGVADETRTAVQEQVSAQRGGLKSISKWNPESFAREQIRHLVGQVFRAGAQDPIRQVVFSAVDQESDISDICLRVGEVLVMETQSDVAVVVALSNTTGEAEEFEGGADWLPRSRGKLLRETGVQRGRNLWLLPVADAGDVDGSVASLQAYLKEIRSEFEYSIVQGPSPSQSNGATAMAQVADGMILVVSAQRTRRAAALKIKQALDDAHVRVLGAVLSDREFPIPEGVYRRL
jgi:protein-tyrosine kinase